MRLKIQKIVAEHMVTDCDVKAFFYSLLDDLKLNFHPDNSFTDYVNEKGKPYFTQAEAAELTTSMQECFDVCEKNNLDIYEIALTEFNKFKN